MRVLLAFLLLLTAGCGDKSQRTSPVAGFREFELVIYSGTIASEEENSVQAMVTKALSKFGSIEERFDGKPQKLFLSIGKDGIKTNCRLQMITEVKIPSNGYMIELPVWRVDTYPTALWNADSGYVGEAEVEESIDSFENVIERLMLAFEKEYQIANPDMPPPKFRIEFLDSLGGIDLQATSYPQ